MANVAFGDPVEDEVDGFAAEAFVFCAEIRAGAYGEVRETVEVVAPVGSAGIEVPVDVFWQLVGFGVEFETVVENVFGKAQSFVVGC